MVGQRAGQPFEALGALEARGAGLHQQHIRTAGSGQHALLHLDLDAERAQRPDGREQRCTHIARRIGGDHVMHVRHHAATRGQPPDRGMAALDQAPRLRHRRGRQQHRRPQPMVTPWHAAARIEIGRERLLRAGRRTEPGIAPEGQGGGDGLALERKGPHPGQGQSLDAIAEEVADAGAQPLEVRDRQLRGDRQLDPQHLIVTQPVNLAVMLPDLDRIRIGDIDHQADLGRHDAAVHPRRRQPAPLRRSGRGRRRIRRAA